MATPQALDADGLRFWVGFELHDLRLATSLETATGMSFAGNGGSRAAILPHPGVSEQRGGLMSEVPGGVLRSLRVAVQQALTRQPP